MAKDLVKQMNMICGDTIKMATSNIKRFTFGENNLYYDFNVHSYTRPGSQPISTIMLVGTNLVIESSTLQPYIPELVDFLATLCIEYNANYDNFHNDIEPYADEIADAVAEEVRRRRGQ